MVAVKIDDTLDQHEQWLLDNAKGKRASLIGADLSGADLIGADLSGADLSGADLSGADLSGADLSGAILSRADLSGAYGLPKAPVVPHIDARIYADVTDGFGLEMNNYHTCETTHCVAGHAIRLAGKDGFSLEDMIGASAAGALIYSASRPEKRVPNFFASDEAALEDLRICAERDPIASPIGDLGDRND